ncbi:hypothetical protein BC936DRAFT_144182 [Jimgerdemannia flammicorona]|uniref:Methyltransferase domain-containing protein n=1 Tax=Jimgerdemannia flammicorona TaxID=994334 RepID=A0A433DCW1_9FUNG|nr:hypothetical protein BC936DRAFT_144182 [Jimgerdemannia flammicorona]
MSRGGPPPQKGKEEKRSTKLVAHPPLPTQIPPHQEHVVPKCPQMNYPYLKPDEVTEEQATDAQFAQPHVVVTDGNLNATQTKKSNPPSFRNVFSRKSKPRDPDSTSILTITTCSSESTLTTTSTALTIDSANARSAAFMDPSRDTKVNPAPRGARAGPPPQKEKHAGDGFFSKLKLSRKGSKGSMSSNDGQRALGQNQNQNQNQNQEYYLPPQPDFYHRPSIDGAVRSGSTTTHSVGSNDQPDAWFHAAWSLASQPPNPLPSPPPPPCAPQVAGHYYYGLVPPPVPSPHTIPGSMPNKALKQRHMIPKMSFDGLVTSRFAAPIEDVLRRGASVLDIGCGSGSWIMDLATAYPTSRFLGIDISLVLLDDMPSNCSIQLVNNLQFPLPFPDNSFDFIRQHFNLAIPAKDWPTLLLELTVSM